jgi:tight adherence protein B
VPEILENTAQTIRELERLHGVLRTKTAEAKGQIYVMAAAPPVVGVIYEFLNPGHFDPFFTSRLGIALFCLGAGLWLGGALIARSMLKVDF